MNFDKLQPQNKDYYNAVIEIPHGSSNKYELNEETNFLSLNFVFRDGMAFPFNYGFLPKTLAEDSDPLDACVFSSEPLNPMSVAEVLPVAVLKLKDRGEQDNKVMFVVRQDPLAEKYKDLSDFTLKLQEQIKEFFIQVGVQKKKTMDLEGFFGKEEAIKEIEDCIHRYNNANR